MEALTFNPPVIAHRGASAYAPENTLIAFSKAVQLGARWIELDVRLSASNEVVVLHDATLERTTNGHGGVCSYPYAYLQSLDAGGWFAPCFSQERIPTLQQVLDFAVDKGLSVNIELKPLDGKEEGLVKAVLAITNATDCRGSTILYSSFNIKAMQVLRALNKHAHIGFLMHELIPNWIDSADQLKASTININHRIITKDLAYQVKSMQKMLTCYTVNDPYRANELYSLGVDAVFTDQPDVILSAIGSMVD